MILPIYVLKRIKSMPRSLERALQYHLEFVTFSRGEFIVTEEEISNDTYFIRRGRIRIFNKRTAKTALHWVKKPGDIIYFGESYFKNLANLVNMQAIEDCACWRIHNQQIEDLATTSLKFTYYMRILLARGLIQNCEEMQAYRDRRF